VVAAAMEAGSLSDKDLVIMTPTLEELGLLSVAPIRERWTKALEAAEASSKLALEATQLGYKVGVRVNLDVLNAQTQLFQTKRDLAKVRYETLLTGLKLRQASGQLQPQDVTAVDALLAR